MEIYISLCEKNMRETILSQRDRLVILAFELAIICLASKLAFGSIFPGNDNNGVWFNTALLCLVLGVRLDTPFFTKPADTVLYAAPAMIALFQGYNWDKWSPGEKIVYAVTLTICFIIGLFGISAILTKDSHKVRWQQYSNIARILAETIGRPRFLFTVVIAYALYSFHRKSILEISTIGAAWFVIAAGGIEETAKATKRLWGMLKSNTDLFSQGEVVAYQTPRIILIRKSMQSKLHLNSCVAVLDPLSQTKLVYTVDYVGRDDGILIRAIELDGFKASADLDKRLADLSANSVCLIEPNEAGISQSRSDELKKSLVGIVATDTSVETLFFEVVKNDGLEEGRLVEIEMNGRMITYQIVNGLTKEETVQQKNTYGFARAQAQKIGEWDSTAGRFKFARWLPTPNSPVFLKTTVEFEPRVETVGHFPKTSYGVGFRKKDGEEIGLDALVTHNTAILGILGVGKSSLALELVERMIVHGIKIICIDLTNQYAEELAAYYDGLQEIENIERLQAIGRAGKRSYRQNVEEGGSKAEFSEAIKEDLERFLRNESNLKLKIYNPVQFEVWKQDSKLFNSMASMTSLTPAEITHIISDATLKIVERFGMTNSARVCLVYEEAHSLIPEWNSAVAEGDKAAANGTARAILQGRKYGLGCLLISQRTANVTKTILNQCNTVFAMRTFDETGRDFLANYLGREYAAMLPSLEERQAVFFGRASNCENPVLIRLNDREEFLRVFRTANPPPSQANAVIAAPEAGDEAGEDIPF